MSDGWVDMKVADCLASVNRDKTQTIPAPDYLREGQFPIIDQGVKPIGGWTNNPDAVIRNDLPVVVFGDVSRTLKFVTMPFARGAQGTQVLRTVASVNPHFFYFALKHLNLSSRGYNRHFVILKEEQIAVPPMLDDQRAIARVLHEAESAALAEARAAEQTQTLKRAVMQDLFSRGLRGGEPQDSKIGPIPAGWDLVPMGTLGRIGNGSTPKRSNAAYWTDGTFPWLTSAKVYDREIASADQLVTEVALRECHLPKVDPGAVLMAITGQGKTLGHVAVLEIPASVSQHIAYIQTDLDRTLPGFLRGFLETQYDYLRQVASGGGSTKGALTCAFLRHLLIPLPSTMDEQQEIVDILDALDAKINRHRGKKALYEELFQALLHGLMSREMDVNALDLSALADAEAVPV